jgi:phage gp29-like protein
VRFDRITRRIPLLLDDRGLKQPLAPFKFVYLEIKTKSGIPIRGGIARPVAWMWMFKNYTLKDWVQFIEIYGQPFRIGKFAPGASQGDQDALLRAVISLASDAGCVIPSTMQIELVEAMKGGGTDVFEKLARYADEQMSKIVLGQTGTTDAAPSGLGGQSSKNAHNDVRGDIERADASALMAAINLQLVRPYIDLNQGKQQHYPWLYIGRPEDQDVQLMIDAAAKLVPLGLKIRQQDIRGAVGFQSPRMATCCWSRRQHPSIRLCLAQRLSDSRRHCSCRSRRWRERNHVLRCSRPRSSVAATTRSHAPRRSKQRTLRK